MILRRLSALVLLACGLAACSVPSTAAPAPAWRPCGDGRVECTTVSVPWDRSDPDGERVGIAVVRARAQDPATRRGTLVLHAGGPAASTPYLLDPRLRGAYAELTRWFDVVTFDSRGFGDTVPACDPAAAPPLELLRDEVTFDRHRAAQEAYAASCERARPGITRHASSSDAADDVDAIRTTLGEDRIAFYGNSYGTVIGQDYARRYGRHLSRLFLDSVVDHVSPVGVADADRTRASDRLLDGFARGCSADPGCALHGADPLAVWDRVVAAADRTPLRARDGRTVTGTDVRTALPGPASRSPRPAAAALLAARDGDAGPLADLVTLPALPVGDAGQLTNCLDFPRPDRYASLVTDRGRTDARTARTTRTAGAATLEEWRCAGWPGDATNPPAPLDGSGAPPALLVDSAGDGAAVTAAGRIAAQVPGSAQLRLPGTAHSAYQYQPDNRCLRDAVTRYLVDGVLPGPDTRCPNTRPSGGLPG